MVTAQPCGSVPLQAPLQATKVLPAGGIAVSATTVPEGNFAEQAGPGQPIPEGVLVTVPAFVSPTDRVWEETKRAVTVDAAFSVTVQVRALPPQAPPPATEEHARV